MNPHFEGETASTNLIILSEKVSYTLGSTKIILYPSSSIVLMVMWKSNVWFVAL